MTINLSTLKQPVSLLSRTLFKSRHPQIKVPKRLLSMAWYCSGQTNSELIENLFEAGLIKNERVKNAMLGVSILLFVLLVSFSELRFSL